MLKLLLLIHSLLLLAAPKECVVTIANEERVQRQELVEVDLNEIKNRLQLDEGQGIIVKNAFGQQVDYQITYDDKLIFDASVRPCGSAKYVITKGLPQQMKTWVKGKMYPTRKDDIAWENDRGAYRVYGPALQQSGEKSYGVDVWTKNTPDIVVEDRYTADYDGNILKNIYHKKGQGDKWKDEDLRTSFHLDHGNGLDCYSVGPTLGCGTPALMMKGQLVFPYCYKDYEILDNGPLRFTVHLIYHPVKIGNDEQVVEHRLISLDKGSNFNKITVWYEGLTTPRDFASGVVIHTADADNVVLGPNYVQYADPTDSPERHNFQIYVAVLFPDGDVKTQLLPLEKPQNGIEGHAIGVKKKLKGGEKYTYYFGSAWSKADVRTQPEWQLRVEQFLHAVEMPLQVKVNE